MKQLPYFRSDDFQRRGRIVQTDETESSMIFFGLMVEIILWFLKVSVGFFVVIFAAHRTSYVYLDTILGKEP